MLSLPIGGQLPTEIGNNGLKMGHSPITSTTGVPFTIGNVNESLSSYSNTEQINLTGQTQTTVVLASDVEEVVAIRGYERVSTGSSLSQGQYSYDGNTNNLSVFTSPNVPILDVTTIRLSPTIIPSFFTGDNIDAFFRTYKLSTDEAVTLTRELEKHPNLRVPLVMARNEISGFLATVLNGTVHSLFGRKWKVASVDVTESPDTVLRPLANVVVNFQGMWATQGRGIRNPLDQPIRVNGLKVSSGSSGSSSLSVLSAGIDFDINEAISWYQQPLGDVNIQNESNLPRLLDRVDVPFIGESVGYVIPTNTDESQYTTGRDILTGGGRARVTQSFVYWSNSDAVEYRNWFDQPVVSIGYIDQTTVPQYQFTGHGALFEGTQLTYELVNARGQRDRVEEDDPGREFDSISNFKRYTNATGAFDLAFPPSELTSDDMRNNLNWDTGGPVKVEEAVSVIGGVEVNKQIRTFGFSYSSDDTHNVSFANNELKIEFASPSPRTLWGQVKTETETPTFDNNGYVKTISVSGNQTARLLDESSIEAAEIAGLLLTLTPGSDVFAANTALLEAYQYNLTFPSNRNTDVILQDLRLSFDDLSAPPEGDTSNYVPPFFAAKITEQERYTHVADDPRTSTTTVYPPIAQIVQKSHTTDQTITSINPPKYEVTSQTTSTRGTYGARAGKANEAQIIDGRPPIHTRLSNGLNSPGRGASSSSTSVLSGLSTIYNTPNSGAQTGVYGQGNPGTVSFSGATTADRLTTAIETEVAIQNTLGAEVRVFRFKFFPYDIDEGNLVPFEGKLWRVLKIEKDMQLFDAGWVYANVELTCRLDLRPPVTRLRLDNRFGVTI